MITFNATKLAAVSLAQSTEATRYYLNGVYFEGKLAVATDGHMLTCAYDENAVCEEPGIYPVSKKAFAALKHKNAIAMEIADGILKVLAHGNEVLHMEPCKPIDGTFPDWRRVVPAFRHGAAMVPGSFMTPVMDRVCQTAKIFQKFGNFSMFGTDERSPYIVAYGSAPDVFSVAMPCRGVTALQSAPAWAAAPAE